MGPQLQSLQHRLRSLGGAVPLHTQQSHRGADSLSGSLANSKYQITRNGEAKCIQYRQRAIEIIEKLQRQHHSFLSIVQPFQITTLRSPLLLRLLDIIASQDFPNAAAQGTPETQREHEREGPNMGYIILHSLDRNKSEDR